MKLILAGGGGLLGGILARTFQARGWESVILTRRPAAWTGPGRAVEWDGASLGEWTGELDGADALLNLAGRSVNCRYHAANRREILDSRLVTTRLLGEAIAQAARPPRVWLQASTATIYAHRYDAPNDEAAGLLGGDEPGAPETWRFSIDVAKRWEAAAQAAPTPHTRQVLLRTSIVMSPDRGGAFDVLSGLVRRGLGGRQGDGRQFVSWMHEDDFARAVLWLLDREDLAGPVNLAAPHPLPNAEFMQALRAAWGARWGLASPAWLLELGAVFLRTETELVLKSRRVIPGRLLASGFEFAFPTWPEAARDLVGRGGGSRKSEGRR